MVMVLVYVSPSISGLVVKFLLAMQEPRVRFPADAIFLTPFISGGTRTDLPLHLFILLPPSPVR